MSAGPFCATCPNWPSGICGRLLEETVQEPAFREKLNWQRFRLARAGDQVCSRNQTSDEIFVVCAGWAFRFLQLPDGGRQILDFLLPGDMFSISNVFDEKFRFSVKALTDIQFAGFKRSKFSERFAVDTHLQRAVAVSCVEENDATHKFIAALGRRSADERVAYLLLNLTERVLTRDTVREHRYKIPLRHQHIADAVGLTAVHVSRVLGQFRERSLCTLSDGVLTVLDPGELRRIGALD